MAAVYAYLRYAFGMQVTLTIPDAEYEQFKRQAERQHRSVEDVALSRMLRSESEEEFRARMENRYPLLKTGTPSSIKTSEVADFDPFDPA